MAVSEVRRPLLLVLRALGLGDLLAAVPALRGLADAFPEHERTLATTRNLAPLALATGAIDRVVAAEPLAPLDSSLGRPDIAVNLHGSGPESHRVLLALEPARLVAFHHPAIPESAGLPRWRAGEHEVARWCRLLTESGVAADPARLELEPPARTPPTTARGATLIHPGAAHAARRWPVDRFAAVARAEIGAGRRVVVTGGPSERDLVLDLAVLARLSPEALYVGGDVLGLAAVVAAAGRVVSGDPGVAHLATALRKPSVVLFGPTAPSLWGPPSTPQHRVLWAGREGDPLADRPDPGLLEIEVDDVLAALADLDRVATAA